LARAYAQVTRPALLQIQLYPEGEVEEVRQLLAKKGFMGEALDSALGVITFDTDRWVDFMLVEEHGLPTQAEQPLRSALVTFLAFVIVGVMPLIAFVWDALVIVQYRVTHQFAWSTFATAVTLFAVGAVKSRFIAMSWWLSGLEVLVMGGAAAFIAYLVGIFLKGVVDTTTDSDLGVLA
jgi:VIT1/CCC1 family predicted Fe2+/Mn2+ transporter